MLLRTFTQNARMIGHLRKEPQLIYYTPLQPKVDPVQLTTFEKNNQGKTHQQLRYRSRNIIYFIQTSVMVINIHKLY